MSYTPKLLKPIYPRSKPGGKQIPRSLKTNGLDLARALFEQAVNDGELAGSPLVPSEPRLFSWPTGIAGAGGADEAASLGKRTWMDSTPRPEFSGGSAGVMGSAEAAAVFGRGALVINLPSGQEVGNSANPVWLRSGATPCGASRVSWDQDIADSLPMW